jgi:hypothetical protein
MKNTHWLDELIAGTWKPNTLLPIIGEFSPELGDVGTDFYGEVHIWTGADWHPPVKPIAEGATQ